MNDMKSIALLFAAAAALLLCCTSCGAQRQASVTATPAEPIGNDITPEKLRHEAIDEPEPVAAPAEVVPGVLIIYVDSAVGKEPLKKAIKEMGAQVIYDYSNLSAMAIRLPKGMTNAQGTKRLQAVKGVLSVQQDRVMHLD